MARRDDTNHQEVTAKSDALFLVASCTIATLVGLVIIFVTASYFQAGEIQMMVSSQGDDLPRGWGGVTPLGVHYAGDLLEAWRYAKSGSPWINRGIYPPLDYAVLYPLTFINYWISYALVIIGGAVATCVLFWRGLVTLPSEVKVLAVTTVVLMSQPMIVAVDRGNLLTLAVALALGGYIAFERKKFTAAGVLFALAGGLKMYPVLFLLLLVRARKWKALAVSLSVGLIATVLPLTFFGDGIRSNLSNWKVNFSGFDTIISDNRNRNNSLLGLFDALQHSRFLGLTGFWESLAAHHVLIVLGVLAVALGLSLLPQVSSLEILLLLASVMYLIIDYAAAYSMIFLLLPAFGLCVGHYQDIVPRFYRRTYCVFLAILLAPKGFRINFWENAYRNGIPTMGTYANPLLGILLILIIGYRATRTEAEREIIFAQTT